MPASLSHTSVLGAAPSAAPSSCHIPASRSPLVLVGSITAITNREYAATIVSTGGANIVPDPSGMTFAGNHRSHCTISPGA